MVNVPKDKRRLNYWHKIFGDPQRKGWKIIRFDSRDVVIQSVDDGIGAQFGIESVNNILKPEYRISTILSEQDDDFIVDAPKEWNQKELTTGDTFNIGDNIYQIGEFDSDGRHVKVKRKKDNKYLTFPISLIQSKLPKNTILVKPSTKLSELLETDDDFTVDAPKEWNEIYLTKGDKITTDMFKNPALNSGNHDWTIIDFNPSNDTVYLDNKHGGFGWIKIKLFQGRLKPQYVITPPLTESYDEWTVDAPDEWNKILLTKGDFIEPDMWNKIPNMFANPPQSVEIGGFGLEGDENDIETVRLIKSDMSHVAYSFQLDRLNNELLKPQYQIIHIVGGNNKWKDLYEENESEDEFNVDAPEEWGLEPLTVGDTITPNMWKDIDKLKYRFQELGVESPTDVLIKKIQCWDTGLENDCVVRLVLKNPPLSLKRILKKSYYDSFGSPTYKSGWFDWFEWINIGELNNSLTSQYKVFPEDSPELN